MTLEQQRKVEENMGLVGRVIRDKVHDTNCLGMYTYDDIYQIGCIGLCKAVMTDKGGTFSTYAYRLIWNEICDALIYATRRQTREVFLEDDVQLSDAEAYMDYDRLEQSLQLQQVIQQAKTETTPFMARCIDVLVRMAEGESSKEIGAELGVSAKQVTAYVSKARKYLKNCPALQTIME